MAHGLSAESSDAATSSHCWCHDGILRRHGAIIAPQAAVTIQHLRHPVLPAAAAQHSLQVRQPLSTSYVGQPMRSCSTVNR